MSELESTSPDTLSDSGLTEGVDSNLHFDSDVRSTEALDAIDKAIAPDETDDSLLPDDESTEREQRDGGDTSLPGGAAAAPPPAAQQAAEPVHEFTAEDFRYAAIMGIAPQQMLAFKHPDHFRTYVNTMAEMRRQQQPQQQRPQPQRFQVQPYQFKEAAETYDPEIMGMNQHYAGQISQMQNLYDQRLNQLQSVIDQNIPLIQRYQQEQEHRIRQSGYDEFDRVLDGYDEALVGRGSFSALTDPQHQQARRAIARKVQALAREEREAGEQVPPLSALVEDAFHSVFRKQIEQKSRESLSEKLNRRGRNTLAVPSQIPREDSGKDGKDKAFAVIDQFIKSQR